VSIEEAGARLGRSRRQVWIYDLAAGNRTLLTRSAPDSPLKPDIWVAAIDSPRSLRPLVATPAAETMPRISPDGELLA
jgi:hypothetical protein